MSKKAFFIKQVSLLIICILVLCVFPFIHSNKKTFDSIVSDVIIHDYADVISNPELFKSKRIDSAIIVIETFNSIPQDSVNQFIKKRFESLSSFYGNTFRFNGILVIGSKEQNFAASWLGGCFNNTKSSSKDYRKSVYFRQQTDSTTGIQQKLHVTLNMALEAYENTSVVKQLAEGQIWDILYEATEPSPSIWYRCFVFPCQWIFSKTIIITKSFWGWCYFLFFYILLLGKLIVESRKKLLSRKEIVHVRNHRKSMIDIIVAIAYIAIPYIFYFIPITLGLVPVATYLSSAGMEYMGAYADFGFSRAFIYDLYKSNISSVSFWASLISSIMFTVSNTSSKQGFDLGDITATIVNAMICAVFFMLPLGLNAVVWVLGWPAFINGLVTPQKEAFEAERGEEQPVFKMAISKMLFSILASLALYWGMTQ